QGKREEEAEAAYRKAIDLKPDLAEAHYNLGNTLRQQFKFDEAAASFKRAAALLPQANPLREQARAIQQQCERFAILNARFPPILEGTENLASAAEQINFAELCHFRKHYAAAARFYRDAFTAEPKLADVVSAHTRYNAACAAALACCRQGTDAEMLDDKDLT